MNIPIIHPLYHQPSGSWSYVVADPISRQCAVIDPVLDYDPHSGHTSTLFAEQILELIKQHNYRLQWILETHAHADHLSSAIWLRQQLSGKIAIGEGIQQVQKTFKWFFHLESAFATDGSQFDHLFKDDEKFTIGELNASVIATPGHTNDSVSYLIGDAVFIGDTLFMPDAGSARCDFPGGDAARLYQSSRRLFSLADSTRVYVCHDYRPNDRVQLCMTTIAEQKRSNIHLNENIKQSQFVTMRQARDISLGLPALIYPAVQVNIRAGSMPPAEDNGVSYLKIPINHHF